eukprot:Rmarinus@m.24945
MADSGPESNQTHDLDSTQAGISDTPSIIGDGSSQYADTVTENGAPCTENTLGDSQVASNDRECAFSGPSNGVSDTSSLADGTSGVETTCVPEPNDSTNTPQSAGDNSADVINSSNASTVPGEYNTSKGEDGHGEVSDPPAESGEGARDDINAQGSGATVTEEDDPVEEEPVLKYQRLGGSVPDIVKHERFTAIAAHERFLALGTSKGNVYILDLDGNENRVFRAHSGTVTDVSIDPSGDCVGTSSEDGTVVINGLYSTEVQEFVYEKPVLTVCLDPQYTRKGTRQFVCGGEAGALVLNSKGWFKARNSVLHHGEGAISCARWQGSLVAWANAFGVKVMDPQTNQRITFIERANNRIDCRCHLLWESDSKLLIGWGDSVQVAHVREQAMDKSFKVNRFVEIIAMARTDYLVSGVAPFTTFPSAPTTPGGVSPHTSPHTHTPSDPSQLQRGPQTQLSHNTSPGLHPPNHHHQPQPQSSHTLPSGSPSPHHHTPASPHTPAAATTATAAGPSPATGAPSDNPGAARQHTHAPATQPPPPSHGRDKEPAVQAHVPPSPQPHPPTRLPAPSVAPYSKELVLLAYIYSPEDEPNPHPVTQQDLDAMSSSGNASMPEIRVMHYKGEERVADALPAANYRHAKYQDYSLARSPSENVFYVMAAGDIVIARCRDADDHVAWLLAHSDFEAALMYADSHHELLRLHRLRDIGEKYLGALITKGDFERAASLAPRLLQGDARAWEKWVLIFHKCEKLGVLAPYIPTEKPRLGPRRYELVLARFLRHDEPGFLRLIRTWPPHLYSREAILKAVLERLESTNSVILLEALAELYTQDGQHDLTLRIYVRLKQANVFAYIRRHQLFRAVRDQVIPLLRFREDEALTLLTENVDQVPVDAVVRQLEAEGDQRLLHAYLHRLFVRDTMVAKKFHEMQVELYAKYDAGYLLTFLRQTDHYSLQKALQVVQAREMYPEMVYILGRMGGDSTREALTILVRDMHDVERAIDFCMDQNDPELFDDLIRYSLDNPDFIGGLLEHLGGYIDPIKLIRLIPTDMEIPGLKAKVTKIISDYRLQVTLRQQCHTILRDDCVSLAKNLDRQQRGAVRVDVGSATCSLCTRTIRGVTGAALESARKGKSGTAARSTIDPYESHASLRRMQVSQAATATQSAHTPSEDEDHGVMAFFCGHVFHANCYSNEFQVHAARSRVPNAAPPSSSADAKAKDGLPPPPLLCSSLHTPLNMLDRPSPRPDFVCFVCTPPVRRRGFGGVSGGIGASKTSSSGSGAVGASGSGREGSGR